jgi:hypothetical protein
MCPMNNVHARRHRDQAKERREGRAGGVGKAMDVGRMGGRCCLAAISLQQHPALGERSFSTIYCSGFNRWCFDVVREQLAYTEAGRGWGLFAEHRVPFSGPSLYEMTT